MADSSKKKEKDSANTKTAQSSTACPTRANLFRLIVYELCVSHVLPVASPCLVTSCSPAMDCRMQRVSE
ncbi:hypothetical protein XELAEV_18010234mg [Xenopus laevis]|uniref:Uncharacterized protein n=1 Tax=Xenopus laevis TaxID=8355 RepID=A0A974DW74_XENLA|nr:hypothetical protein XELAEV_18010234mg [Xenopus laevis]